MLRALLLAAAYFNAGTAFCQTVTSSLRDYSFTLSRFTGYRTHETKTEFFNRLTKAGMQCIYDSVKYGDYYYDTSSLAPAKTERKNDRTDYFWRIRNFSYDGDTIPEIVLVFKEEVDGDNLIEPFYFRKVAYPSYRGTMNEKENRRMMMKYYKGVSACERMIKLHFTKVYCKRKK